MRLSTLLLSLPLGANALSASETNSTTVDGKKYIIEVAKGSDLAAVSAKILAHGNAKILKTFSSDVFSGFSVESADDNVDTLEAVSEVAKAWPVRRIQITKPQPELSFSDDATAGNYSVHEFTGVAKLHKAGILGKGALVGVVDTGISYRHPALGGGIGPGYKVAGGMDLVGDGIWPSTPKAPDNDPDDFTGHGTHVAGIIAGKGEWFTGVAPEATLLAYKVFSQNDQTDEDTLIDAFLAAYDAGVDIITSSIGGLDGFTDGPWALVASRLVEQGVLITVSAGNSGDEGVFFGSSGAYGQNVLAVASLDPGNLPAIPFEGSFSLDGQTNTTSMGYNPAYDLWEGSGRPIIPVSLDTKDPAQACSPLPAGSANFTGAIALVRRGTCNFSIKQQNLYALGAEYVMVYSDDRPVVLPSSDFPYSDLAMIEARAGEAIVNTVKAGGKVTVSFPPPGDRAVGIVNPAGGIPSQYTSWGASYELNIKPNLAAPGRSIYSTYPGNSFATLSGTSMACPYVAGIAALYVSQFGGRKGQGPEWAKKLADRLVASGVSVPWQTIQPTTLPVNYGFNAPAPQVGAGAVDAFKVLNYTTSLKFDSYGFNLNDSSHFSRYHKVEVTNGGKTPVTYSFALQPAGAFNAQSEELPGFLAYIPEITPFALVPTVSFPSSFTLQPGQSKVAQFNFAKPEGADEAKLPFYSGKVLIKGSNGEELGVPYFGAAFDLKRQLRDKIFTNNSPYQRAGPSRLNIEGPRNVTAYDFNLALNQQNFPKFYFASKWGTKQLRWDIFEAGWKERDWKYPPVAGQNGYVGSVAYWAGSARVANFNPASHNRNDTVPFPVLDVPRTGVVEYFEQTFWWMGKLANGSYIAPGNYQFRFAAQVPFGDPRRSDNWDIWKTPQITVLPYSV